MSKRDTNKESNDPVPSNASLVDTGKVPEPPPSGAAELPHEDTHPHKGGKHIKVPTAEWESLQAKAAEADKAYDQLLRARADFDNYRRRMVQEKQYTELAANEKLFTKLLGILDTFDLALASADKATSPKAVVEGVKLVQNQLQSALKEAGLEEIDAIGKPFDPNLHEAIQQLESDDDEEGTVLQQIRKGYRFKDRLLRPATVVISKKHEPAGEADSGQGATED